jgi:hypothetical protein
LDVKTRPTSEKNKIMLTNFEKYVGTINWPWGLENKNQPKNEGFV